MPKYYCEYCGIYLTHCSPSGRRQHESGRKHIQSKIDYYTNLLIEAHQEGNLDQITNIFNIQENIPNFKADTIRNPFNNESHNINDMSAINLAGLNKPNISYLPLPGLNLALSINPSDKMNSQKALQNLLPSKIIDSVPNSNTNKLPPILPGALGLPAPGLGGVLPNINLGLNPGAPPLLMPPNLVGLPGLMPPPVANLPTTGNAPAPVLPPNLKELAAGNEKPLKKLSRPVEAKDDEDGDKGAEEGDN